MLAPRSFLKRSNSSNDARASFMAKSDPMLARTASTENGSQLSPTKITPPAPVESEVRSIVPSWITDAFERDDGVAVDLIERCEPLLVGADHRLRIVALADLGEHVLAGLNGVDAPRFGLLDKRSNLGALASGGREDQNLRPRAQFSRLNSRTRAFRQEQAGLGASLLQMQALERLNLRIRRAGNVMRHEVFRAVRPAGCFRFSPRSPGIRRALSAIGTHAAREEC